MKRTATLLIAASAFALLLVPHLAAAATVNTHPFATSLTGAALPAGSLQGPQKLALDSAGNLYARDGAGIVRLDPSGAPVPFSALGSPVINGQATDGEGNPDPLGTEDETPIDALGDVWAIAVDRSGTATDGRIYAITESSGATGLGSIFAFAPSGAYLYTIDSVPTTGDLGLGVGLAVDTKGNLYAADFYHAVVHKFDPTGALLEDIALPETSINLAIDSKDNLYASGSSSIFKFNALGEAQSPVSPTPSSALTAADLSDDHLYIANGAQVDEYDAAGAPLASFGSEVLTGSAGIAATGGTVYISDANLVQVFGPRQDVTVPDPTAKPATQVGFFTATLNGEADAQGLGPDSACRFEYRLAGTEDSWARTPEQSPCSGSLSAPIDSLTHNTAYEFRLVGINSKARVSLPSATESFTTLTVPAPTVEADVPADPTGTGAHLTGRVNPQGASTMARFEYSDDGGASWQCLNLDRNGFCSSTSNDIDAGSGTSDVELEAEAKGLEPNSDYLFRIVASNLGGDATSDEVAFHTDALPPLVNPVDAGIVTETTAQLGALINPRNSATTYYVEYSTDPNLSEGVLKLPAGAQASAGSGNDFVPVAQTATSLTPDTVYYSHVVADNGVGAPITGPIRSFRTLAPTTPPTGLPDGRVYEMVSPLDKAGAGVERGNLVGVFIAAHYVAADGDAVVFASKGNFGGDAGSLFLHYVSRRGPAGWSTTGINAKSTSAIGAEYQWFLDSDLSLGAARYSEDEPLHPADPTMNHNQSLFLRDTTKANDSSNSAFQLLSVPSIVPPEFRSADLSVQGSSADGSHIIFLSGVRLLPQSPANGLPSLYEWVDGKVRLVAYLPGDIPASMPSVAGSAGTTQTVLDYPGDNPISEDGSRIFFHVTADGLRDEFEPDQAESGLYVRENGEITRPIAIDGGSFPFPPRYRFEAAKPADGSVAFFSEPSGDLYRWDANADPGQEVTNVTTPDPGSVVSGDVLGTLGISDDASKVYFVANGDLAPGASTGDPNIYLWQQGVGIRHVAPLPAVIDSRGRDISQIWGDSLEATGNHTANVSSDGDRLLFESAAQLTAYDTDGHTQIYLYDASEDRNICVSCSRISASSVSDARFSVVAASDSDANSFGNGSWAPNETQRNLTGDGRRAFFDTEEGLLPADTNGKVDTYEWQDGRLHLISSGDSSADATFFGSSDDGDDVFFATSQALARRDTDTLIDIYDARVGGIPDPAPIPGCSGDECQGTPNPPPTFDDPATSGQSNAIGNLATPLDKGCPRSKHRKHGKCVKKHKAKKHSKKHRANNNRGDAK